MPTRIQNLALNDNDKPHRTRFATKTDIEQLTKAIDRVRNDSTRYLICMVMDLVTEQIAAQEREEDGCDKDVCVN